jgi:hypothetical protein
MSMKIFIMICIYSMACVFESMGQSITPEDTNIWNLIWRDEFDYENREDLHPAKGVYSSYHGCTQYHGKGIYTIPYRCLYSRNISNLFLAGRLISVSHVAFGSTRVIATGTLCAIGSEAIRKRR